ncbi:MAG: helix-turn-helix domain-containing protein [Archangium sp.]
MLTPAPSLASYAAKPAGKWWAGPSFIAWCAEPELFGFTLWGQPNADALTQLVGALKVELGPNARAHASLVDASLVQVADPAAFEVLQRYVVSHLAQLRERVTKLALVRPGGLPGAVVAGFFSVLESPYPTQVVTSVGEGLAWLGASRTWGEPLEALRASASGVAPLVLQVRSALAGSKGEPSVNDIAKALGLSSRTLQRRLGELGTSFVRESSEQRLQAAAVALSTSDVAVTTIALEAGFSSSQAFSAAFRRFSGKTPGDFRKRRG